LPACLPSVLYFLCNHPSTTQLYTLSLHDALPIFYFTLLLKGLYSFAQESYITYQPIEGGFAIVDKNTAAPIIFSNADYPGVQKVDRKSTRLNSSHVKISYAVFCLKQKKENQLWLL